MTCLYIFNIFIELFCLTTKTGVFESLHYKIIPKNDFYCGSSPYIHSTTPVPKRKMSCCKQFLCRYYLLNGCTTQVAIKVIVT